MLRNIRHLNIFPGEFVGDLDQVEFDDPPLYERDSEKQALRSQVGDLEQRLAVMQQQLMENQDDRNELTQRNQFLCRHMQALESEVVETRQENDILKQKNSELEKEKEKTSKKQVLGRKKLVDLGPDAVARTKASYREKVANEINSFGENRGLVVQSLILRDEEGRQLEVNAEKPNTYATLNPLKVLTIAEWY